MSLPTAPTSKKNLKNLLKSRLCMFRPKYTYHKVWSTRGCFQGLQTGMRALGMCFAFQGRNAKVFNLCYKKAWTTVRKIMNTKCYRNIKNAPSNECRLAMNQGFVKLRVFRDDPEPSVEQFNATEDAMMTAMGEEVW